MAKVQSDESRYESRYGGGFITPAQYIAEVMCERVAKKNKKDLPIKFWNLPAHKRNFMVTILAANALLKLYHPKAIIAALRKSPTVYSLRAPWLDAIIQEEQEKLDKFVEEVSTTPSPSPAKDIDTSEKPRESFVSQQSTLNKLRGLDG